MSKRLTVVYEVPDDYDVTRITGTGELAVVCCEWIDALERLQAAEAANKSEYMRGFNEAIDDCQRQLTEQVAGYKSRLAAAEAVSDSAEALTDKYSRDIWGLSGQLAAAEADLQQRISLQQDMNTIYTVAGLTQRLAVVEAVIAAKLHKRRCWDCGHVFYAADAVVPYCSCEKCNSQDTRRMKDKAEQEVQDAQ